MNHAIPLHLMRFAARAPQRCCQDLRTQRGRYAVAALTGSRRCCWIDRRHGRAISGNAH